MKLYRILAIIERDMRKFFRSPALMVSALIFPLMQLIVLGYAFGGKIRGVKVAVVDEDRSSESRMLRERFVAIGAVDYSSLNDAVTDLRAGFVRGVVHIPEDYSRRVLQHNRPRIAFVVDNTDNFMRGELEQRMQQITNDLNGLEVIPRLPGAID